LTPVSSRTSAVFWNVAWSLVVPLKSKAGFLTAFEPRVCLSAVTWAACEVRDDARGEEAAADERARAAQERSAGVAVDARGRLLDRAVSVELVERGAEIVLVHDRVSLP
jgi:hypothetical protein